MEEVLLKKILDKVEQIGTDFNEFKTEMYEFRDEMHKFKNEMYEFENQVHKMLDQHSKEIAMEINELAELISKKFNEFKLDSQREFNINKKDHIIYEAQIEKLQTSNKYIESKIHI